MDALGIMNRVFSENQIDLPLENVGTTDRDNRTEEGLKAQETITGMSSTDSAGLEQQPRSSRYLARNCFGDYYTRGGLEIETREMLTLAILVNLGTEVQISRHIMGNTNMGRSREFISDVIYTCLPYAGYPRILNALNCLETVIPETGDSSN